MILEAGGEGYFRMFGAMSVYPEEPWFGRVRRGLWSFWRFLLIRRLGARFLRGIGEVSEAPETPWSDTDTFGAVLTFTFAPLYPDPEPAQGARTRKPLRCPA